MFGFILECFKGRNPLGCDYAIMKSPTEAQRFYYGTYLETKKALPQAIITLDTQSKYSGGCNRPYIEHRSKIPKGLVLDQ